MNVVYVLLPIALLLGLGFTAAFAASAARGQFDDLETPAHRMLIDDDPQDSKDLKAATERRSEAT